VIIEYIWDLVRFMLVVGIIVAVIAIGIAVALVAVLLAIVYGLASPTRTPASCLRALVANTREGVAQVRALRPS
jgi:hypothetical protein